MELTQLSALINPHYAFPIVGVLVCALLVFLFGFKSPAQPPSFDFDDEKKTSGSKKRKSVKKGSGSSQMVSLPDVSVKASTSEKASKQVTVKQAKQKQDQKSSLSSVEYASTNKQPIKNKKSEKNEKNALKKKEEKVNEEKEKQTPKKEEIGEWVQQLTRKERKNRKRDEGNGDEDDLKMEISKVGTPERKLPAIIKVQDSNESSPSKRKKKKPAGNKENGEAPQLTEKVKLENTKNETILKEKSEKEEIFKNEVETKIKEELKETNDLPLQPAQTKEDVNSKLSEKAALLEQLESKESHVEASPKTKKLKKNKTKVETTAAKVELHVQDMPAPTIEVPKPDIASRDAKVARAEMQSEDTTKTAVEVSVTAGGVAFDELADVFQEPKVQKKKKKARKDQ